MKQRTAKMCFPGSHLVTWFWFGIFFTNLAKASYVWKTGKWTDCDHTRCGGGGLQTRAVWCAHTEGWGADKVHCDAGFKPDSERDCFKVCQHHSNRVTWITGQWTSCKPRIGQRLCAQPTGIQIRKVTCILICGNVTLPDYVCENFLDKPSVNRTCSLPCPQRCVTTRYSNWSSCTGECPHRYRSRQRHIIVPAKDNGKKCPSLVIKKPCRSDCTETEKKKYIFKVGPWTNCTEFPRRRKLKYDAAITVTLGLQTREVTCIDSSGNSLKTSICEPVQRPSPKQVCTIQTPCQLSEWSAWSLHPHQFSAEFGWNVKFQRTRSVLKASRPADRECRHLEEESGSSLDQLDNFCKRYEFITGTWGPCRTVDGLCGSGFRERNVICVQKNDSVVLNPILCLPPAPVSMQACNVPCPAECLVTDWSEWSTCQPYYCRRDRSGAKRGHRTRTRQILHNLQTDSATCPPLKETQPCVYPLCYTWKIEEMECVPKIKLMLCGPGIMTRRITCVDTNGESVNPYFCFETRPETKVDCLIPCASDCVLSDWTTWSGCSVSCNDREDVGVRTRHRIKLALSGAGGVKCPEQRHLVETETCHSLPCDVYHWTTEPWEECKLVRSDKTCGMGNQRRKVTCNQGSQPVSELNCLADDKPVPEQNCTIPCTRRCRGNYHTAWTPCSATCVTASSMQSVQTRHSFDINGATDKGDPCQPELETRPCLGLPKCSVYRWQMSLWTACILPHAKKRCGHGYRARRISCVRDGVRTVDHHFCLTASPPVPDDTMPCHVTCHQKSCHLSEWSAYGPCTGPCGVRKRFRTLEGMSRRVSRCHDQTVFPLEEHQQCPCPKYRVLPVGNWSHCILDDVSQGGASLWLTRNPGRSPYQTKYCGVGKRYQALSCVDQAGNKMPASVCSNKAFTEEMCFIPCPIDGIMSPWSEWSGCTASVCGVGNQLRERYFTLKPLDGGRALLELDEGMEYQKRPCPMPCGHHSWLTSAWSDCSAISQPHHPQYPSCGPGLQSRTVRCVFQPPGLQPVEVGEENCDPLTLPENTNYCHLPCPGQCVTSPWSEWSICPPPCSKDKFRSRARSILRKASHDKEPCPHSVEREPCILGNNCFDFVLEWSEWGPCTLGERATCGQGQRQRVPACRRNDGRGVSVDLCEKLIPGTSQKHTHEVCEVPCAEDCVMSEWGSWGTCSSTCGEGAQQRQRRVVRKPTNRGRLCPKDLVQSRPCDYLSCNSWNFSHWSPCQTQKGACGHGSRTRELWCQRSDGTRLDDIYCQHVHKPDEPLKESCHIHCPGDCLLSEWLSWGPCHKPCGQNLTGGTRTRARLILKHAATTGQPCQSLLETRPCSTRVCHSFHWVTSDWIGQHREVWCQRNDGLRTYGQGGCDESTKPSIKRLCPSSCHRIQSAFCTLGGQCMCGEGLTPIYSESRLEECARLPTQGAGQIMITPETSRTTDKKTMPEDGPTNFWMYAVIAAGCCFGIFVAIVVYKVCGKLHEPSSQRPKPGSGENASPACTYGPVNTKLVIAHMDQKHLQG